MLGANCPGCGVAGPGACARCRAELAAQVPAGVAGLVPGLPPVVAAGAYAGVLRRLLLAAKERHALGLLPLLGGCLAAAVRALVETGDLTGGVVLVPVPSAGSAVAERGLDFTAVLAGGAARTLRAAGMPARVVRSLALVRRPSDQAGLGRTERLANLAGAFRVRGPAPAGRLVVVDDIVTTGATARESVRTLGATGARVTAVLTLAHA